MSDLNKRDLDNYITGHWGEDQLRDEDDSVTYTPNFAELKHDADQGYTTVSGTKWLLDRHAEMLEALEEIKQTARCCGGGTEISGPFFHIAQRAEAAIQKAHGGQ